jgi:hypothetical protein
MGCSPGGGTLPCCLQTTFWGLGPLFWLVAPRDSLLIFPSPLWLKFVRGGGMSVHSGI